MRVLLRPTVFITIFKTEHDYTGVVVGVGRSRFNPNDPRSTIYPIETDRSTVDYKIFFLYSVVRKTMSINV